ncbi:hypothetical protein GCWU000325_02664 [Alloprevotella tannerae ATCC 51259]|uniref:Uncharacterized protein n=1 Tax=Alloprevotella tannerae ATCC 51259 TaxID=626522 RepID=C9LK99_9BACT|nr:hypothetical protein GCWU000325_02664 [Alloprevotella tannerae ATCC 51259]
MPCRLKLQGNYYMVCIKCTSISTQLHAQKNCRTSNKFTRLFVNLKKLLTSA